ncbi:ADP-L-glycero-D-manno-heptose-6-epimerase [Waddlia chondrophila 2032/99]|uniref:ADP-L-glycero-D-manno-heptose-6-epimerase n=2 Tax=Waddlia chondrophila TaxID=71667 RepID=D6YVM5_WADCW|nr:ADP-glyceromanno-heptose 6-epimerase [Waddlia chondrophila]ADI38186.1 ADP-L-glycero-D-mannoheptose-6-epimerase [Waddlia chondrophila WSU 86-1044]CCB90315.1 ADP-L-glycero-D-manno-heptose-6-epimerase [Waddlia chondrophila 2032/99]
MNVDDLIIVTGAAGFIGASVVRHLNDNGRKNIILIDNLEKTEKWQNLIGKSFIDIIPIENCFDWLKGKESEIGGFIHLGACSSTVEKNADYLLDNNYRFSVKLAEYALSHNHRFIYASSAATYGNGSKGFSDDHSKLETLEPLNMYGYSKHLFDLWAKKNGVLDRVVGLKYFNVFGPNEAHKGRMASAIVHLLSQVQREGEVRLFQSSEPEKFADGDQCRDFIYIKDAVRMTCAFFNNDAGGIFNIGTGKAGTWNQIAHALFKALDKEPKIEYIEMPEDLIGKYQNYTRADMSKTAGVLGQSALCEPLEASVIDYVRNYLLTGKKW